MPPSNLEIHLNDHMAGAVGALGHIDRTRKMSRDPETAESLRSIRQEVSHDREVLRDLMNQLDVAQSTIRNVSARLGQLASALKFHFTPGRRTELRTLQALDVLSAGIEGKRSLWVTLSAAAENDNRLAAIDYATMTRRAEEQLELVDQLRSRVAKRAFTTPP